MTRQQLLTGIDADEYALWKAKYATDGGFGEDKQDRRTAYHLLYALRDGKTTYEDLLTALNPSMKREESVKERVQRLKAMFQGIAAMAKPAPPQESQ